VGWSSEKISGADISRAGSESFGANWNQVSIYFDKVSGGPKLYQPKFIIGPFT